MTVFDTPVPRRLEVLTTAPSLPRLLAGAALTTRGRGGDLPHRAVMRQDICVDADHLAAYDRVCRFPLRSAVPLSYPHLLVFPLQMTLMVERDFPLALPGLIHVSNEIAQRAPLRVGDLVTVTVWAADLRPHPRGTVVDLHGRVERDGEAVWMCRSTYLRRGPGPRTRDADPTVAVDLGPLAARWRIPADAGRRYAAVSGDVNPIHLHPLTARAAGMPGAIAHGMWTFARSLAALDPIPDAVTATVRFECPVRLPSRVDVYYPPRDDARSVVVTAADDPDRRLLTTVVSGAAV